MIEDVNIHLLSLAQKFKKKFNLPTISNEKLYNTFAFYACFKLEC